MRRRLNYANVAATLALVFSMSGGALAASHYLISSTKQISPKILAKLKGATGKTGATGATGAPGTPGAPGKEGKEGAKGETGPSHAYSASGAGTASVNVPAGSYAVSGDGLFYNFGVKAGAGECTLEAPGLSEIRFATVPNTGEEEEGHVNGSATIANNGTAVLKTAGTIKEKCNQGRESQAAVSTNLAQVTAVLVGGVN